jgi:hypothetical protein
MNRSFRVLCLCLPLVIVGCVFVGQDHTYLLPDVEQLEIGKTTKSQVLQILRECPETIVDDHVQYVSRERTVFPPFPLNFIGLFVFLRIYENSRTLDVWYDDKGVLSKAALTLSSGALCTILLLIPGPVGGDEFDADTKAILCRIQSNGIEIWICSPFGNSKVPFSSDP